MRRFAPLLLLLALTALDVAAHSPEDAYNARADMRVDDQRGLRVRTWFEVPEAANVAQSDAEAAVAQLAECLELTLNGEKLAGSWRAGDDPKHGLSNGSHLLFALEFEPAASLAGRSLDVALVVGCFAEEDLSLSATTRAKSPWRVADEALPEAAHHHASAGDDHGQAGRRSARIHFVRD